MDDKNLKSSVVVVLVALLIGLVGQATTTAPPSYHCFKPSRSVVPSMQITVDQLLSELGTKWYTYKEQVLERVFRKLEYATEKDKANTILGQYSVQQLLDWNTWTLADCTSEAMDEMNKKCFSLCDRMDYHEDDPPKNLIGDDRLEAFIKHNVGGYCWTVKDKILAACPYRELDEQIGKENLDRVWDLYHKTHHRPDDTARFIKEMSIYKPFTFKWSKVLFDAERTKKSIDEYLAAKGPSEKAELQGICSKVIAHFDRKRHYSFTLPSDWYNLVQFCRCFTSGFTNENMQLDPQEPIRLGIQGMGAGVLRQSPSW